MRMTSSLLPTKEALRYAAVSVLGFYLLAALLMFFAVRRLRTDWVDDAEPNSA